MEILKTTRTIRLNGQTVPIGMTIQVEDSAVTLFSDYARKLHKVEVDAILDDYVEYAKELFHDEIKSVLKKSIKCDQGKLF